MGSAKSKDFGTLRACRVAVVAALYAFVAAGVIDQAMAFELFGRRFFERDDQRLEALDPLPYEISFEVAGVDVVTPDEEPDRNLEKALKQASLLYSERKDAPSGTSGLLARARADYARLVAAHYARGRYGPVVQILIDGRLPEAIAPDEELAAPVPVTVRIDPGPVFRFGRIDVVDRPPFGERETRDIETPVETGLVSGAVARSTVITRVETNFAEAWRELGYPKAEVTNRTVVADHATRTVDVAITVNPGRPAVFGPVAVTGTERMDSDFVAYMTDLPRGERYDPDEIDAARDRLRRLQVFRSIRLVEAETIEADGSLPITVRVAERKPRVFGAGASLSTIDGGAVETYWMHRNLFGRAERLRLEGKIGGLGVEGIDKLDYFAGATFTKPGVFTPDTDVVAKTSVRREFVETYEERSVEGQLGLAHRFNRRVTGDIALHVERSRIEDAFGINDFLLFGLPSELTYDDRNNDLDPTRGWRATLYGEPFYEAENGNAAFLGKLQASTYRGFGARDRVVVAARASVGSVVGGGGLDDIPSDRRFLAGGGGSIRGYAYKSIGVEGPGGETVAGRSLVEGSLELRARVRDRFGVVPFIDIGDVFSTALPDFTSDTSELRAGAGIGIRYYTALGPLRLDVARALDPGIDDPNFAIYVGIGQAF